MKSRIPVILFAAYCIWFIALAFCPHNRAYWFAANLSPLFICLLAVGTYNKFRFSTMSYFMAAFLLFLQTLGAHYYFYNVSFNFFTEVLGFSRNHFDRVVHVSVGFYAYPFAEYLLRKKITTRQLWIFIFSFTGIMTIAALYEILEWIYVMLISPGSNADFLGAQGDIWDAQKDMLSDGIGALFAIFMFRISFRNVSVSGPVNPQ
nr:DUF2238 domain-containing protein [uncultured Draconibacterium sp.]